MSLARSAVLDRPLMRFATTRAAERSGRASASTSLAPGPTPTIIAPPEKNCPATGAATQARARPCLISRNGDETIMLGVLALKMVACKRLNRRSSNNNQRKDDPPPRSPASVTETSPARHEATWSRSQVFCAEAAPSGALACRPVDSVLGRLDGSQRVVISLSSPLALCL